MAVRKPYVTEPAGIEGYARREQIGLVRVDGVHWLLNPAFERAEHDAAAPQAAQDAHLHS